MQGQTQATTAAVAAAVSAVAAAAPLPMLQARRVRAQGFDAQLRQGPRFESKRSSAVQVFAKLAEERQRGE